jgi:methyl-accepting chemotaxis protein
MTEKTDRARKRYVSLRVKIWIGFILIFTPVFIASYYWFYQFTSDRVFNRITTELVATVDGAIKGMDVDNFVQLYKEESTGNPQCPPAPGAAQSGYYPESDPRYLAHVQWLYDVQQISPNTKLYTYVKGPGPGDIIAIGSTGYFREPRGGFKFCELYNSQGNSQIADGLVKRVDRWTVYNDAKFGKWITTYAPIVDSSGQIVGAIGVDIGADYLYEVRQSILWSGAIAFVISYIFIFLLVYWLSGLMTRPIVALAGVAKEIGEGDYEQEWSRVDKQDSFRDEIDTLTTVFRSMVAKVAEREKSLRARVAQLEIMIDPSKLEKQVSEIVESDFFVELKSKVRDMRSRFKDGPDEDKPGPAPKQKK